MRPCHVYSLSRRGDGSGVIAQEWLEKADSYVFALAPLSERARPFACLTVLSCKRSQLTARPGPYTRGCSGLSVGV